MTTNISLDAMVAQADWESLTRPASSVSHTPGPWSCSYSGGWSCWSIHAGICDFASLPYGPAFVPPEEQKANAHLIAAAPEMLAALKLAVDIFREMSARGVISSDIDSPSNYFIEIGALRSLGSALRKATGAA